MKERFDSDDPYKLLAIKIIVHPDSYSLQRILEDDLYVRQLLINEMRRIDYAGPFMDTVLVGLYKNKRGVEFRRYLDNAGKFLFENLELEKLRNYIRSLTRD